MNNGKRINLYIGCQLRVGVNISMGMNHLIKVSPDLAGEAGAKLIVNAKQRIFFRAWFVIELSSGLIYVKANRRLCCKFADNA